MTAPAVVATSRVRRAQFPAYAAPLFAPRRYKVMYGGRSAGRSWAVARALLIMAAQRPLRILCTRELQTSLKDSVLQLLTDQIALLGLEGFKANKTDITHENGSRFLFEGLRLNVRRIKSLEGIDICWVEEAERITKESWSVLIPTIRKAGSEIWVTFNPNEEDDATYVRFVVNPPQDCWSKKVNSEDNPWLEEVVKKERAYDYANDPESADHVWGGNIRRVSDAQILRGKWKVEEFEVPYEIDGQGQEVPLWGGPYQGEDFGFSQDPHAALRCWVDSKARILYIEYESWHLSLELEHIVDTVNHDIPDFSEFVTRADSARPDSISYLRRNGLPRIEGATKKKNSIADGIAHLRKYRWIVVHPRCVRTRDECKRWSYKVDLESGNVLPIVVDAHNHLMDSLRYALEPLIKPQRKMGFHFVGGAKRRLCPECSSRMGVDGRCPTCGWSEPVVEAEAVVEAGNGNGHAAQNGRSPISPGRFRGINGHR